MTQATSQAKMYGQTRVFYKCTIVIEFELVFALNHSTFYVNLHSSVFFFLIEFFFKKNSFYVKLSKRNKNFKNIVRIKSVNIVYTKLLTF